MNDCSCTSPFKLPETELKGEFIYERNWLFRNESQKICREMGGMLVPAKSLKIMAGLLKHVHEKCVYINQQVPRTFHIGIHKVNATRIEFSDGTEYVEELHGHLFKFKPKFKPIFKTNQCIDSLFRFAFGRLDALPCRTHGVKSSEFPFFCYKPPQPPYSQVAIVFVAYLIIVAIIAYTKYALKRSRSLFKHTTNDGTFSP